MKAIQVSTDQSESPKICSFSERLNEHEDVFMYRSGMTDFIIVTEGECSMAWVKARIVDVFEIDSYTIKEIR